MGDCVARLIGGKYELHEVAGKGGMATVWRASLVGHRGFRRPVAVKHMHEHLAERKEFVDMFVEEARVGADMSAANVARTYDFVEQDGEYYLIMEWVDGIDLGSYVHYVRDIGMRTRWELVVAVGIGMLRGLTAAHERQTAAGNLSPVVHRDMSPHNVLLTRKGMVKVIDFGLCLAYDRQGNDWTEPGVLKGKMSYLAPEIVAGEAPSPATDQFAVGSVLWEALVGRKLFDGPTDVDVFKRLRTCQVQPLKPQRPDVPSKLVTVLNRALSPTPDKRFPTCREMARHLGLVLKTVKARNDLHLLLGASVDRAMQNYVPGERTESSAVSETPIRDIEAVVPTGKRGKRTGRLMALFGRRR